MLCGNPDMVRDVTAALKDRGFAKKTAGAHQGISLPNYW